MADYIYLFQNRLTPAQRNALEAVRDVARTNGMPVFLVGGAARDLTSGTPVRDLDFAVQGDVVPLVKELQAKNVAVTGENPVLNSRHLLFPGGVRAELGPTLTVTYPKPSRPETHPAAILDDLRRRDFTANAMAVSLNEGSYGLLLDPLNGVADIENRELRLVSNYGFLEQPALLLRAARLSGRLGWTLETRTQGRYENAKEENFIGTLAEQDRNYELEEIFYEEDPLSTLDHLAAEGWAAALADGWTSAKADRDGLERVRDLIGQLEQLGIHIDPAPVFFPLLTAKLSPEEVEALKARFVRPGFRTQIEILDARAKELGGQITGRNAATPSEVWRILFAAEPEVVLWLAYSSRSGAVQGKLKAFLNEWPQMRQRVPYALMGEMRITPDRPDYEKLLEDLFFALIDGKLDTPEATRAFLEPYSPPAPVVQANPRRRPAKAARSRSKKAAAARSADTDTDLDTSDAETDTPETDIDRTAGDLDTTDAETDLTLDTDSDTDSDSIDEEVPSAAAAAHVAPDAQKGNDGPEATGGGQPVAPPASKAAERERTAPKKLTAKGDVKAQPVSATSSKSVVATSPSTKASKQDAGKAGVGDPPPNVDIKAAAKTLTKTASQTGAKALPVKSAPVVVRKATGKPEPAAVSPTSRPAKSVPAPMAAKKVASSAKTTSPNKAAGALQSSAKKASAPGKPSLSAKKAVGFSVKTPAKSLNRGPSVKIAPKKAVVSPPKAASKGGLASKSVPVVAKKASKGRR